MTTKETEAIKQFFKHQLATNEIWALRGLQRIYSAQTASEQASGQTHELNSVGFSGCDAEILSSFCEQLNRKGYLSHKQMALVYKKMPRYWKQLFNVVEPERQQALIDKAMNLQTA